MKFAAFRSIARCTSIATVSMGLAIPAMAASVTNGSFEATTNGDGQLAFNTNATGWTSPDYNASNQTGDNFIFSLPDADSTGSTGNSGAVVLWGPNSGVNNGLTASPDGGNFIGASGDAMHSGRIQQTINGLIPNTPCTVDFWMAASQQKGNMGATSQYWQVSLGSQTQGTSVLNIPGGGFSGWSSASLTFTPTSSSAVLSFLAIGTPSGLAPIVLLDGVSITQTPEPTSLMLLACGGVTLLRRVRRAASE